MGNEKTVPHMDLLEKLAETDGSKTDPQFWIKNYGVSGSTIQSLMKGNETLMRIGDAKERELANRRLEAIQDYLNSQKEAEVGYSSQH